MEEITVFFVSTNCVVLSRNVSCPHSLCFIDCVVNYENESDFEIKDFIVPTNCVLPSHPNNHETSTGFCKFFAITGCNQSSNHRKIYSQKENFRTFHHEKVNGTWRLRLRCKSF